MKLYQLTSFDMTFWKTALLEEMKILIESVITVCQWHRHRSAPETPGTGPDRHQPAPTGTGTDRHRPVLTGLDQHKTGTDRPGLFYDVIDTNFVLNRPKRYDILKILIKNVIKQLGPVMAGLCRCRLVPVYVGPGRSGPVGAGAGCPRRRLYPVPTGAAD
jgi:hypothetical protein